MTNTLLKAVCALALTASAGWAEFTVNFTQCTEFAGVGPVSFTKAAALVPSAFTTLTTSSTGPATAGIVVRATSCQGVSVNGGWSVPTNISQIGIEIVPPDGTGDINNYTLVYVSNNLDLVLAFNFEGVPAIYDPTLTYQFTYDSTGKAGVLYAQVEGVGLPPYTIYGAETDPTAPGSDFKANWWYGKKGELIKQASDFPAIAFGTASVTFLTDKTSLLGQLIGGNADSDFHFLPVRGVYPAAHMVVTLNGK